MNAREHAHRVHFIIKQLLWCIYSHSLDITPPEEHKIDTCDRCVRDNNEAVALVVRLTKFEKEYLTTSMRFFTHHTNLNFNSKGTSLFINTACNYRKCLSNKVAPHVRTCDQNVKNHYFEKIYENILWVYVYVQLNSRVIIEIDSYVCKIRKR